MLHARLCRMHSDPISLFQDRDANPGAAAANRDGKEKLLHQNVALFRSFFCIFAPLNFLQLQFWPLPSCI